MPSSVHRDSGRPRPHSKVQSGRYGSEVSCFRLEVRGTLNSYVSCAGVKVSPDIEPPQLCDNALIMLILADRYCYCVCVISGVTKQRFLAWKG